MKFKLYNLLTIYFITTCFIFILIFLNIKFNAQFSPLILASVFMLPICLLCLNDLQKPISLFGELGVLWYLACCMESLKLSSLQSEFSTYASVAIFFVPFAFLVPAIFMNAKTPVELSIRGKHKYEKIAVILNRIVLACSFLFIFILYINGKLPILSVDPNTQFRNLLPNIIQIFFGIFLRVGFMFCLYICFTKKNKTMLPWFEMASYFIIAILLVTRSDIIYYAIMTILFYFIFNKRSPLDYAKIIAALIITTLILFSVVGNIRQGEKFNINKYSSSKIENQTVSWLNSYFAFNINNLATQIDKATPTYTPSYALQPVIALFQIKKNISWYKIDPYPFPKLNMATGYNDFVIDYGGGWGYVPFLGYAFLIVFVFTRKFSTVGKIFIITIIQTNLLLFPFFNEFTRAPFWIVLISFLILDKYIMAQSNTRRLLI